MSIIASDPSQIVVYSTAEKTMARCFLYYDGAQLLVIDMQLITLASGKDKA